MKQYHEFGRVVEFSPDARTAGWLIVDRQDMDRVEHHSPVLYVSDSEFADMVEADRIQYFVPNGGGEYRVEYTDEELQSIKKHKLSALFECDSDSDGYRQNDMSFYKPMECGDNLSVCVTNVMKMLRMPVVIAVLWYCNSQYTDEEIAGLRSIKGVLVQRNTPNVITITAHIDMFCDIIKNNYRGNVLINTTLARNTDNILYKRRVAGMGRFTVEAVAAYCDKLDMHSMQVQELPCGGQRTVWGHPWLGVVAGASGSGQPTTVGRNNSTSSGGVSPLKFN